MEQLFEQIHAGIDALTENPYLGAVIALTTSVGLGYLLRWLLGIIATLTGHTKTELDERVLAAIRLPALQTVVLFGLYLSVGELEPAPATLVTWGRLLMTFGLIIWARALLRISNSVLRFASERTDALPLIERRTLPLFSNLTVLLVLGMASYAALEIWDRDVTTWAASAGVLGIAFGLAAKDTLGNLFSGVFIVADAPYQLGDYIVMDNGQRGMVVHIGLRSTRIQTRDDVQVTIPNSVIAASKIVNQSGGGATRMRVRVKVGIAYDSDIDLARSTLEAIANGEALILPDPAPRVRFRNLGPSALEFELLGWVDEPANRGRAIDALNTAIVKTFREQGIEIPFPQQVVHLHQQ